MTVKTAVTRYRATSFWDDDEAHEEASRGEWAGKRLYALVSADPSFALKMLDACEIEDEDAERLVQELRAYATRMLHCNTVAA